MSESSVMEIYEIEVFSRTSGWKSHEAAPWIMKSTMQPCSAPEDIGLPSGDWSWFSNWRIDKQPGLTDEDGWGYASRLSRLHRKDRRSKAEALFSRARRRLWSRVMRREAGVKAVDFQKVLPGVQKGLTGVNAARIKIEEILKTAPEAAKSDQMVSLVASVKKNIVDIIASLDALEKQAPPPPPPGGAPVKQNNSAIIKKLRNDVAKEEAAIDKALNPNSNRSSKAFLPLRKQGSLNLESNNGNHPSRASFSTSFQPSSSMAQYSNGAGKINPINSNSNKMDNNSGNGRNNLNPFGSDEVRDGTFTMEVTPDLAKQAAALVPPPKQAQPKAIVKGGGKGAFNAGVFSSANSGRFGANGNLEPDEGQYMDRSVQELMIEQKFIAIDEATVMQEIIDERSIEIEKVHKGLIIVNEMFSDLSKIVEQQSEHINDIYKNVDESHAKTKDAFGHIVEADRLQKEGNCVIS